MSLEPPTKIPSKKKKYSFLSKALSKECPSMFPKNGVPMDMDAHFQSLSGSPVKEPSLQVPLTMPLGEGCPVPRYTLRFEQKCFELACRKSLLHVPHLLCRPYCQWHTVSIASMEENLHTYLKTLQDKKTTGSL